MLWKKTWAHRKLDPRINKWKPVSSPGWTGRWPPSSIKKQSFDLTRPSTQATIFLRVSQRGVPYAGLHIRRSRGRSPIHASSVDVYSSSRVAVILRSPRTTPLHLDPIRSAGCIRRLVDETGLQLSIHVGPLRDLRLVCGGSVARHKAGREDEVRSGDRRCACQLGFLLSDH